MGFFDFLKGKEKKIQEQQQKTVEQETKEDSGIEIEGLEIQSLEEQDLEDDKRITLEINDETSSRDIHSAVNRAMSQKEVEFHIISIAKEKQDISVEEEDEVSLLEESNSAAKEFIVKDDKDKVIKENLEESEKKAEEPVEEELDKKKESTQNNIEKTISKIEEPSKDGRKRKYNEEKELIQEITSEKVVNKIEDSVKKKSNEKKEAAEEVILEKTADEIENNIKMKFDEKQELIEDIAIKELPNEIEEKQSVQQDKPKKGFFARLIEGLDKTRKSILGSVDTVLGAFTKIDEELFEELEEVLIMADLGVETTMGIIENLRKRVKREKTTDPKAIKGMLIDEITMLLQEGAEEEHKLLSPTVMLVIGVNGVGKTTTIGKLSSNFKSQGKKVLLAAADTFRAAAIDQLEIWSQRAGIDMIKHQENSDPAAVIFDAVKAAKNRKCDLLICDTAGRLHNKKNLMEELKKIAKVIDREYPEANKEVYLVLDATTGQNAMQQAKLFQEVADITGIILTKLDGTAKGGIVIAIKSELKIPVRYIGVGEGIDDLQKFDAKDFAKALFGEQ